MHFQHITAGFIVGCFRAPYNTDELAVRDDFVGIGGQVLQDTKLDRRQPHPAIVHRDPHASSMDTEPTDLCNLPGPGPHCLAAHVCQEIGKAVKLLSSAHSLAVRRSQINDRQTLQSASREGATEKFAAIVQATLFQDNQIREMSLDLSTDLTQAGKIGSGCLL